MVKKKKENASSTRNLKFEYFKIQRQKLLAQKVED